LLDALVRARLVTRELDTTRVGNKAVLGRRYRVTHAGRRVL
jgi:hypothetical protein